ncbi:TetR/AcrR family transcriptional regulator [Novosphingobium sp. LASN5T]|nr:TetR/AcrR family transcriptional regulator [Novosphingobium sp. LASN5T]
MMASREKKQRADLPTNGDSVRNGRARRRLSREELTPEAKERIFAAAAQVVGVYGYMNASMKRITQAARIAEGTFYLYFSSRQALFDELLPHVGAQMLRFVGDRVRGTENLYEMEERGFRAFFAFLKKEPGFFRILNEAESAAPDAHRAHFRMLGDNYLRALRRGVTRGEIRNFDDEELEAVAYMLMAARNYLHLRYVRDNPTANDIPEKVVQAYMKIVRDGLR